jgi:predicted nucleotidyltransferase
MTLKRVAVRMRRELGALRVILYGSAVRGDMDAESDIDVLAVLPDAGWEADKKATDICFEEDVGLGRVISCMTCTPEQMEHAPLKASPWLASVLEEGNDL